LKHKKDVEKKEAQLHHNASKRTKKGKDLTSNSNSSHNNKYLAKHRDSIPRKAHDNIKHQNSHNNHQKSASKAKEHLVKP
jgi:hypothetical protein